MGKTELENEFRQLVNQHKFEIEAKVKEASDALAEAEELADKYGIPFYSDVSRINQGYTPKLFLDKFEDELDADVVYKLTQVYDLEYEGWAHSAVC